MAQVVERKAKFKPQYHQNKNKQKTISAALKILNWQKNSFSWPFILPLAFLLESDK
jgi:hypothetical protein